jgi:hypothetical protein
MKVRHLMVPDLDLETVERAGLASRAERCARLVSSFPSTVAAQEATLLTGSPPATHGVLFAGEAPRIPRLIESWHERVDGLTDGGRIEEIRARILESAEKADVLLVSGCPVGDAVERVVEPVPAAPDGLRLQLEDAFALCELATEGTAVPQGLIDEWLRTPGIERVLAPSAESAGAWMAPPDRGWILVAERGWAFRPCARAFGRIDPRRSPVLLAFGEPWAAPWPASVHDWRVAPTVLALAGADPSGCADAPLDGAPGRES